MEIRLMRSLQHVKYTGPLNTAEKLKFAIEGGAKSFDYVNLVCLLASQLKALCKLDETVNSIASPDDSNTFVMEVSSFLKELGCPYLSLITGHLSDRLQKTSDKQLLLDFLLNELLATRMLKVNKPVQDNMEIKIDETETAKCLRELLETTGVQKTNNATAANLLSKIENKLREVVNEAGTELVGRPAFTGSLNADQWENIKKIQAETNKDFAIRREMLLKRMEVTIDSFKWSDRMKDKGSLIEDTCQKRMGGVCANPGIDVSDLLAARSDIFVVEKITNASVRKNTQTQINKVIIGNVPDRGGRSWEQEPPPPEMPAWQKNRATGSANRGGFRGNNRGNFGGNRGEYRGDNQGNDGNYGNQFGNSSRGSNDNRNYNSRPEGPSGVQSNLTSGGHPRISMDYCEQFIQESQHNQQYQRGGRSNSGRGARSYHHRGEGYR